MSAFFLADGNFWFNVSIGAVFTLCLLELASLFFGISLLGVFDNASDIDVDGDVEISSFSGLFSWLSIDKLPIMIWLVLLLTAFGIVGYSANYIAVKVADELAPAYVSIPAAFILGLLITGRTGALIARLMPKNESSALREDDFVGSVANITLGTANMGSPAEAKFVDHHNQQHYVMVEPMESNDSFVQGDQVVLVQKVSSGWLATRYQ